MEWKIKRGDQEFTCGSADTLRQWAGDGRIQREDYVFNPVMEKWLYAKDTAEIQTCFSKKETAKQASRLNGLGLAFGITGIVISMVPMLMPLGGLLFLIGLVLTVAYYVKRP
jgi:hypothetical protein